MRKLLHRVKAMNYKLRLKELRLEKNITQQNIADNIGIARQTYNHYEVGENIVPLKHLNNIANFYDVSVDYVLNLTDKRKYDNYDKEINAKKAGEILKKFRKENKLTQVKLATYLNTFHTVIVDYESGKNLIATAFLYQICKKYKISADYLLGKINAPIYFK